MNEEQIRKSFEKYDSRCIKERKDKEIRGGLLLVELTENIRLVYVSPDLTELLGYSHEQFIKKFEKKPEFLFTKNGREEVVKEIMEKHRYLKFSCMSADGGMRFFKASCSTPELCEGKSYYCIHCLDVTKYRRAMYQVTSLEKREKVLVEKSEDCIFEWNITENKLMISENWKEKFEQVVDKEYLDVKKDIKQYIHREDLGKFNNMLNQVLAGGTPGDILLRCYKDMEKKKYFWCSVSLISVLYDDKTPMFVIGRLKDIDYQLKQLYGLASRRSSFFMLANGENNRPLIDKILKESSQNTLHAIIVLRLDYFKGMEERLGKLATEIMLETYSDALARITYERDVISYEKDGVFSVFLNSIGSLDNIAWKVKKMCNVSVGTKHAPMTACAGVAVFPFDGRDYNQLYVRACETFEMAVAKGEKQTYGFYQYEDGSANTQLVSKSTDVHMKPDGIVTDIVEEWFHAIKTVDNMKKQVEIAETQIMLNQIQPHFIYNTLANIKAVMQKDSELAGQMIVSFSKCLRIQLDALGKDRVAPFKEIIELLKNYIALEKMRFRDKINVHFELECMEFSMPHFILQPLVENAIRHGICKREEGGDIWVRTKKTEKDNIIIEIEDNGVGFSLKKRDKLGIGLENVKVRVQYLMNGEMDIVTQPDKGTKITLIM